MFVLSFVPLEFDIASGRSLEKTYSSCTHFNLGRSDSSSNPMPSHRDIALTPEQPVKTVEPDPAVTAKAPSVNARGEIAAMPPDPATTAKPPAIQELPRPAEPTFVVPSVPKPAPAPVTAAPAPVVKPAPTLPQSVPSEEAGSGLVATRAGNTLEIKNIDISNVQSVRIVVSRLAKPLFHACITKWIQVDLSKTSEVKFS
jgi:hypothetical protein